MSDDTGEPRTAVSPCAHVWIAWYPSRILCVNCGANRHESDGAPS